MYTDSLTSGRSLVDAHLHLWDTSALNYPWLHELPSLHRPFLVSDYREASQNVNVEAMVFVQCETEPAMTCREVDWIHTVAHEDRRIKGIVAFAPLERGDASRSVLDALKARPLVKGVRRLIQSETDPRFCLESAFIEGLRHLPEYGFTFDICIDHTQLANTVSMVRMCPEVRFVLDHIAKPDIRRQTLDPWREELRLLAELPNVYCKISGLVTEANVDTWRREDLKPYIDHTISCFGFDRVMFGGDWPVCTLASSYERWVETLDWALAGCSEDERKRLFRDNALAVYALD